MIIVLQNGLSTEYFDLLRSSRDYSFTFSLSRWRNNSGSPIWISGLTTSTEIKQTKKQREEDERILENSRCARHGIVRTGFGHDGNAGCREAGRVLPQRLQFVGSAKLQLFDHGAMSGGGLRTQRLL